MKKLILSLLIILSSNIFAGDSCQTISLLPITNSYQLAAIMGKNKLFNIRLMMKYEDDAPIPAGDILFASGKNIRSQVLHARMNSKRSGKVYFLEISRGKFQELKLEDKVDSRSLASEAKSFNYKLCNH